MNSAQQTTTYRIFGTHPDTVGYCLGSTNDLLFGDLGGEEEHYSRTFATREEAEKALVTLQATGDWDGERPEYEIEES